MYYFKPFWGKSLKFNWQFGMFLIFLFGIPRFIIVLNANQTANYNFTSLVFLAMWITPFLLLNRSGRKEIGISRPKKYGLLPLAFILGILFCTMTYSIGVWFFKDTMSNWFVYISNSYKGPLGNSLESERHFYFTIFAIIGMTFSPIGEELLYRGLVHEGFARKFGDIKASLIDSSAFALVHLAHFGIIYVEGNWEFRLIPSLLWLAITFMAGRLFFFARQKTASIYGAILCHAGFNLAMTYFIFYHIL